MKKYPEQTDFSIEELIYGVSAPYVGIGVYTADRKFSWPDIDGTTQLEYLAWKKHLNNCGYEVPKKYSDFYEYQRTPKALDEYKFELAANTITQLTKAVDLATETLAQISSESTTTESSYDDLVKLENRVTKKAYLTIKQIAEMLEVK